MKIRLFFTVLGLALGLVGPARAAEESGVEITSDKSVEDLKAGQFHFWDNVRVDAPGVLTLTCGDLVALIPAGGGRLDRLVATNNVVIEVIRAPSKPGEAPLKIRAFGQQAVYLATNETVTLTGNPRIESPQADTWGDTVIYELNTGRMQALGRHRTVLRPAAFKGSGLLNNRTNAPAPRP